MKKSKLMKYLITIIILILSTITSNAQSRKDGRNCISCLRNADYEMAIECFDDCLTTTHGRCSKDKVMKYFYAGVLYYEIFDNSDSETNNLDTNAIEKSIKYFYTALLNNIAGAPCYKLDYKVNNERTIIIEILNNPNTSYIYQMIKTDIINRYLPTIKRYTLEHRVSEESKELLGIMLELKKENTQD